MNISSSSSQLQLIPSQTSSHTQTQTQSQSQSQPQISNCQICQSQNSKYTCPNCKTRTCSLQCSQSHKISTKCTGIRNKSSYIPMNQYGWGSLMDDFCFLEDVGRKVGEIGREIVSSGFDMNIIGIDGRGGRGRDGSGRGRGRGRGGKERGGRGKGGKSKREILKMELDMHDIEMDLLPTGMQRRNLNQSNWDNKKQTALLTIQFRFHPTSETKPQTQTTSPIQPYTLLTHRNDISTPLLQLMQTHVKDRLNKKTSSKANSNSNSNNAESTTSTFPIWIQSLVIPPPEDPENFTMPKFVMTAPPDPLILARSVAFYSNKDRGAAKPKLYHSLDPNEPLVKSLGGTQFFEFPLIEIYEEFSGIIVDKKSGGVRRVGDDAEPQRKRRKVDPGAMNGLVGEYGSDEDEEDEEGEGNGVAQDSELVEYHESDGEGQDNMIDDEIDAEEDEVEVDPAVLLELMCRAQKEGKWLGDEDEGSDVPES